MQTLSDKVMKYCSYQERSWLEVRRKMAALKMPPAEAERLLADLVEMNFVSDERFAESFIRGLSCISEESPTRSSIKNLMKSTMNNTSPICVIWLKNGRARIRKGRRSS